MNSTTPPRYNSGQTYQAAHEPAWMREPGTTLEGGGAGAGGPPLPLPTSTTSSVHETTPLCADAGVISGPPSAASSVGRPSKHIPGYRPYVHPKDIRRGACLSAFVGINCVCVLSALSVAVAEILSIVYHPLSAQGIAIRVYGVVFSFGVVFTELGW